MQYYQSSTRPSKATYEYECGLDQFLKLGLPATKIVAWLEAVDSTAADVFVLWHAMLRAVTDALDDPENAFSADVKENVLTILDMRSGQLFGDTRLGSKIYRAAAFLNPSTSLPTI